MLPKRDEIWAKQVGERLRDLRKKVLNKTQADVAASLGVSPPAIVYWEKGIRFPDVEKMRKLKHMLGVSLDWIYDGDASRLPQEIKDKLGLL